MNMIRQAFKPATSVALRFLSIFMLCLVMASAAFAAPPDVAIEFLEVVQPPTPNPALLNKTITAQVKVHLKNAANEEIEPPAGTTFDWECTGVRKDNVAVATNTVSVTDTQTTTMTASFASAGQYAIDLRVTVANAAWKNDNGTPFTLQGSTTLGVKVSAVIVSVTGPGRTKEGTNSDPFTATVEPAGTTVASYSWVWAVSNPEGATIGNNPQVNFAAAHAKTTTVQTAHWFAKPDNRLAAVAGGECTYVINCEVVVNGVTYSSVDNGGGTNWSVYVPEILGKTDPPKLDGMAEIGVRTVNGGQEWYVKGMGDIHRVAPVVTPYIETSSQFYNKAITVHEQRHVTQLTTGVPGLTVHTFFDPVAFYDSIKNLTTSSAANEDALDLKIKIGLAMTERNRNGEQAMQNERYAAEKDAFTQSNAVAPDYLEVDLP